MEGKGGASGAQCYHTVAVAFQNQSPLREGELEGAQEKVEGLLLLWESDEGGGSAVRPARGHLASATNERPGGSLVSHAACPSPAQQAQQVNVWAFGAG